jgi:lipopolysaccharide/colanic/teichoic acid biosynthesis glycosyltransferase
MVKNADKLIENFSDEQKAEFQKYYKLENDPRVTKIGKFLRKTSLDELPQILNIFAGSLSFVGPRPITQEETLRYKKDRDLLLSVKPGLTGLWAVSGRSTLTYEERIKLELKYVKECSLWFDIKIFFKTIVPVFKGHGAK